jgi:hypothetical protein
MDFAFSAKGVTRVTVGFSDLFHVTDNIFPSIL